MADDLGTLISQVMHLHQRAGETSVRLRLEAELLADTQEELATLLTKLCRGAPGEPSPSPPPPTERRMVRLAEVCRIVGLARSTIWGMVGDGRFPEPRRLGPRFVGWISTDLDAWMTSRSPSGL